MLYLIISVKVLNYEFWSLHFQEGSVDIIKSLFGKVVKYLLLILDSMLIRKARVII